MNPSHPFSHRGDPDNRVALPSASMYLEQYHLCARLSYGVDAHRQLIHTIHSLLAEIYGTKSVCRRFFVRGAGDSRTQHCCFTEPTSMTNEQSPIYRNSATDAVPFEVRGLQDPGTLCFIVRPTCSIWVTLLYTAWQAYGPRRGSAQRLWLAAMPQNAQTPELGSISAALQDCQRLGAFESGRTPASGRHREFVRLVRRGTSLY